MFAVRIQYLTGRVYASEFDEGDAKQTVEWPPHQSRFYSALVASWAEGGAEVELRPALEWLEKQPPAAIHYQPHSPRAIVNAYVPVNDSAGVETLPDERPRKARTFPSASLQNSEVWFVWPQSIPDHLRRPMDLLLRRTPSLGHSASLISAEISNHVPNQLETLIPGDGPRARRMRIVGQGRLVSLEASYRRFSETGSKVHRPSRGRTALFTSRRPQTGEPPVQDLFREMSILRRAEGERAGLLATFSVTSALRGALLKLAPQPPSEVISGHAPESTDGQPLRSERPHVAFAALSFTGSPHATGDLGGVAVLLPHTLTTGERNLVLTTLAQVRELGMPFGSWRVERPDLEEPNYNLQPETWTRPSQQWATVTPYVFDRYPRDPWGEEAQETVRASFERVGFPPPVCVSLLKDSVVRGAPPAPAFPPAPARPGKPQRFHIHALVTFERPISGPVIAGAGRYYGYGLFRPFPEQRL